MAFVMAVTTDSWHYRYCQWIRKYWGNDTPIRFEKACPYWQSMIWLTVVMVLTSWIFAIGWIGIGVAYLVLKPIEWLVGYDEDALPAKDYTPTRFDRFLNKSYDKLEDALESSAGRKTALGILFLIIAMALAVIGTFAYVGIRLFFTNTLPDFITYLPRLPGDAWRVLMGFGDGIFQLAAIFGEDLVFAGHKIAEGAVFSWDKIVWFFTYKPLWIAVGKVVGFGVATLVAAMFLGYVAQEISSSSWMQARRKAREEKINARKKLRMKREATLEELKKERAAARLRLKQEMEKARAERAAEAAKKEPSALAKFVKNIANNLGSRKEKVGDVTYKVMGFFPLMGTMLLSGAKGLCPQIEFLTPEELERRKAKAEAERQAKLEKARKEREEKDAQENRVMEKVAEAQKRRNPDEQRIEPPTPKTMLVGEWLGVRLNPSVSTAEAPMTVEQAKHLFALYIPLVDWEGVETRVDRTVVLHCMVAEVINRGVRPGVAEQMKAAIVSSWGVHPRAKEAEQRPAADVGSKAAFDLGAPATKAKTQPANNLELAKLKASYGFYIFQFYSGKKTPIDWEAMAYQPGNVAQLDNYWSNAVGAVGSSKLLNDSRASVLDYWTLVRNERGKLFETGVDPEDGRRVLEQLELLNSYTSLGSPNWKEFFQIPRVRRLSWLQDTYVAAITKMHLPPARQAFDEILAYWNKVDGLPANTGPVFYPGSSDKRPVMAQPKMTAVKAKSLFDNHYSNPINWGFVELGSRDDRRKMLSGIYSVAVNEYNMDQQVAMDAYDAILADWEQKFGDVDDIAYYPVTPRYPNRVARNQFRPWTYEEACNLLKDHGIPNDWAALKTSTLRHVAIKQSLRTLKNRGVSENVLEEVRRAINGFWAQPSKKERDWDDVRPGDRLNGQPPQAEDHDWYA